MAGAHGWRVRILQTSNLHHAGPSHRGPGAPRSYAPRDAEACPLTGLLRDHLDEFIAGCDDDQRPLPRFVDRQLRAITTCGDLTHGFVRLECTSCRGPRVVPFSCKVRLCPSCAGRRMNEQAAHLVDRVLPQVPYRQWVLTLPGELARVVAFDGELSTAVFGVFADELSRWQRERANDLGIADPQTGSLLEIQRFADGARLYPHAHAVVPDGVFVASSDGESAHFIRQDPPSDADVAHVVSRVEQRLTRVLARWRAGRHRDSAHDSEDTDILPVCAEVRPTEFVRLVSQHESEQGRPAPKKPLCARSPGGLELHAEVTIAAHDRKGLERLCRYLSRPPIPQDRLERRADGKYVLSLKRTWKGGLKAIVFEPLDLIARLAALVPAPYLALRRFHGVFAPHHTLRALIVPTPSADSPVPIAPMRPGRMSWGDLLMRVWTIDALKCPHCGGRMRVIAAIHDPDAITAILAAVHSERWVIPATGPPIDSPLAALAAA